MIGLQLKNVVPFVIALIVDGLCIQVAVHWVACLAEEGSGFAVKLCFKHLALIAKKLRHVVERALIVVHRIRDFLEVPIPLRNFRLLLCERLRCFDIFDSILHIKGRLERIHIFPFVLLTLRLKLLLLHAPLPCSMSFNMTSMGLTGILELVGKLAPVLVSRQVSVFDCYLLCLLLVISIEPFLKFLTKLIPFRILLRRILAPSVLNRLLSPRII